MHPNFPWRNSPRWELTPLGKRLTRPSQGVPVTGLIADDKGELKLARRYADGSIEWIEEAPSSANGEMGLYYKGTTDNVLYNYVNPVDVVDISDKEHLFAELVTTDAFVVSAMFASSVV